MDFIRGLKRFKIFQHSFIEPCSFYLHQIKAPNSVAKMCGLDVYTLDYKMPNKAVMVTLTLLVVYLYANATTAYELRHETEDLINCWVTIGLAILVVVKTATFAVFRKDLLWLHQYTETLYREECNPRTKNMLMHNIFLLSVILKAMLLCYALTSCCLDAAPLLFLVQTGEKTLPFGFYIPHIDRFSWVGYAINYAFQIILTIYVSSGDMGPDCLYMIISMNSFTQIDLLIASLSELNDKIQNSGNDIGNCLEKIIRRHQEHLKWVNQVSHNS